VSLLIIIYLFILGIAALLAEMVLPVIFSMTLPVLNALGFGSALIPLVVIYASLELGDERALLLACVLGLSLDLTSSHHLGSSGLLLGLLSLLIMTQARKPMAHLWIFRLTFVLVGTFGYLVLDYFITQVELVSNHPNVANHWVIPDYFTSKAETGRSHWPLAVWSKITFASLSNLVLCPFFFVLAGLLPRLCGWKPAYEFKERRFQA
jgi:rod shape-determining protein MreD